MQQQPLPYFDLVTQRAPVSEEELLMMRVDYMNLQAQQLRSEAHLRVAEMISRELQQGLRPRA